MRAGSHSAMPYLQVNHIHHRKSQSASRHSGQWGGSLGSPGSGKRQSWGLTVPSKENMTGIAFSVIPWLYSTQPWKCLC